eukprot:CAMPEP_0194275290 /NCGR_PEP_ID=MMETSP0169-20130528/8162_1 /TAXON_ID=218684 /ORGANISM="Corethron pennatum, Strain L29A3" /LENGTH=489 /DNA_ID=CAMNT_0039018715 /DNA_START=21 /DNA_END=1490 /DNA_ORIENTATION=-
MSPSLRSLASLYVSSLLSQHAAAQIPQIHGSGTTNPSKCLWKIMRLFEERSRQPLRLTYRAIGSGNGQKEFLGADNGYAPHNDFGAGDIAMKKGDYDALTVTQGRGMLHVPFVIGAVNFFHSVSGFAVEDEVGLKLDSCTLAKIFKGEITNWNHADIVAQNPASSLPDESISVVRRLNGSSSTASITKFLRESCPDHWPEALVGKVIDWPSETVIVDGSNAMSENIRDIGGAIGYIDVGHGHAEALSEICLKNKDGSFLSSKEAHAVGGIMSPVGDALPSAADADFSAVDVLNEPGVNTFPIVLVSYLYVRKDLGYFRTGDERTLFKLFLRKLLDPEIIAECAEFGFTGVPENVRSMALAGIDALDASDGTPWIYETEADTLVGAGMGQNVISEKRRDYAEYARSQSQGSIELLQDHVFTTATAKSERPVDRVDAGGEARAVQAALVVSVVSMVVAFAAVIVVHLKLKSNENGNAAVGLASNHKNNETL